MTAALNQSENIELGSWQASDLYDQNVYVEPEAHSYRVLIVDDDNDIAEGIKFILESYREDISCEIANDAYEALAALSDQSYNLVFVDQKMPGLKGTTVLSWMDQFIDTDPLMVESGKYASSVPAVLMSGADVEVPAKYDLRHFNLVKILNKKDLSHFLSENFAH